MDSTPRVEGLKPCPFCGGEPEVVRHGTPRQSAIVRCTQCGCARESSDEGCFDAWNRRTPSGETDAGGEPIGWVVVMWDDQGFPGSDEGLYGPDERSDAEEWAKTLNGLDNGYTYTVHPVGSTVREDGEIRTALAFAASVIKGGEPWTGRRFASL